MDLISRHDAIEVVRKWFDKMKLNGDICIDGIISLPSAQQNLQPTCNNLATDMISRRVAIEIIQSMYPGMPRVPWMRKDWQKRYEPYIRTENAIRELPSVQLLIEIASPDKIKDEKPKFHHEDWSEIL